MQKRGFVMGLLSVIVPSYNEEDNIALAARTVA